MRKGIGRIAASLLLTLSAGAAPALLAEETSTNGAATVPPGDDLGARYASAALVAQVQIAGIHRDVDSALSEPGMVALLGYVYSAVSRQVWKGEANRLIAFRLGLDACDKKLVKGGRYLIFASPDSYGRLQLRSCDAAVPEAEAAPLLAQLKQIDQQG
ncbi:hypothetical protein [Microbulbifer hainanensis]|uniref:hypothetical protein n=1 Tax=Microbulbifer hainanensis TaxID=2735675 RepID=UPI0018682B3F|nr:hypothetical protein [Microbulbifer hainanensis]